MLEIPEAQVIAQQINAKLKGERVLSVIVNASPHKFAWFNGDPEAYAPLFSGLCLDSANARGGQVEISFGLRAAGAVRRCQRALYTRQSAKPKNPSTVDCV